MKLFKILVLLCCLVKTAYADDIVIVKDGGLKDGLELVKKWKRQEGYLSCSGAPDILASKYLVEPNNFTIKARLSINLDKTAAGIKINENLFGFDGGNNNGLFLEGAAFNSKSVIKIPSVKQYIKSNKAFDVEITVKNQKCSFYIDNALIWQGTFDEPKTCLIALRPQRSLMKVYSFYIKGTAAGKIDPDLAREIYLITAVDTTPKSIYENMNIKAPKTIKNGESYTYTLKARGNKKPAVFRKQIVNGKGFVLNSKELIKAYKSCHIDFAVRPIELTVKKGSKILIKRILSLYDPEKKNNFPEGKIVNVCGSPDAMINGKMTGTLRACLARNQGSDKYRSSTVRDFYNAGINEFIIWVRPSRFASDGKMDEQQVYDHIVEMVTRIIADAPKSHITIYWQLYMPPEWCRAHPDELIKLDVEKQELRNAPQRYPQPSYASNLWRQEAGEFMYRMLLKLKTSPIGDRVAMFKLSYANCGEWNHWGYHEKAFVDFSLPMQRAFVKWLKNKYRTEENMNKAWGRDHVSFNSDSLVPDRTARMKYQNGLFRNAPGGRQAVDYYEFFQEMTVDTIEYFAKIVKKASDNRLLVGAYYGYYLGHLTGQPYHFQDSGSYALGRYLRSPYLDFLGGPYPYSGRRQNAVINGVFSSIALHGKMWESEGDQRTHLSAERQRYFGKTDSLKESIAIAKRDFMMNMAKHGSYYFFDFVRGWFKDKEFMATVKKLLKIDKIARQTSKRNNAQVAVFVNEKDIPWLGSRKNHGLTLFRYMFTHFMDMVGAPWEMFLLSDMKKVKLSRFKMVIFANAWKVSDSELDYIRYNVRNNNRTVLFLWAPGIIDNDGKLNVARSYKLTGIKIGVKPDAMFRRLNSTLPKDKLYLHISPKYKASFMTYINDLQAKEIARFQESGLVGAATRKFSNHKSIVFCFPGLNAALLRRIYRAAGVHIWNCIGYDKFYRSGPFVSLYSYKKGGKRRILLPYTAEVVIDVFSGKVIGRNTKQVDFSMGKEPETKIFYAGRNKYYR